MTVRRARASKLGLGAGELTNGPAKASEALVALLTLDEVAACLRLNPRTIRRLVANGRLPCARLAGRLRFFPADVVRFVEARKG